ncbi:rRNA maturation RNase YbeY [candidate division WWE3 bacterium]|uniref:Endoribonuclease YbeY n=1 Tax=candidate division WWE3 bacterium TaxID=2053526 RepID=A0A955LWC5_UNCKA|nr:rRNA maturation RNase YbeY [candidate division WWE3 bacterium]
MSSRVFSFTIVDDDGIRRINKEWFNKDTSTDVISFSMIEHQASTTTRTSENTTENDLDILSPPKMAGEIVVNENEVQRNAEKFGVTFEQEMARVVAHGVLHLYGYEDDTDDKRNAMKAIEDLVVEEF